MFTSAAQPPPPRRLSEDEPLLGHPGDVAQPCRSPIFTNFLVGTAPLAQAGGLIIAALIWGAVFTHKRILFSAHPLFNSLAILLAIQAVLILQPTHTPEQKKTGTYVHASFWAAALRLFYAALVVVEVHKARSGIGHFESPHAVLGVFIYALLFVQTFVGVTQYFVPQLYGGEEKAKALYRYHRVGGYRVLTLMLVNVVLATYTYYAGKILGIKTWATVAGSILVVLGVAPRIKKQKVQLWNTE